MRVGVFGGTFDPPHTGHVLLAGDACEALGLERVIWVPASQQPLKGSPPAASAVDRGRMVELTVRGDARFALDTLEIDRGGLSFTVDTLRALRAQSQGSTLVLLVGADAWASFDKWRDPNGILELADVAVLARSGEHASEWSGYLPEVVTTRRVDISSTEIRERVRRGLPIRGFVTDAVREYITAAGLYRQ